MAGKAAKAAELTPMMRQYMDIKRQHEDCILLYRLGDFYEMFFEDAKTVSRELELTLTGRDCGLEERAPMCGVPFHSAEGYIARLIQKGYKVAVCEQMEDPATYGDPDLLRRLTQEQKEIEPVVETYRACRKAEDAAAAAHELLGDPELREMAQEEIRQAKADIERLRRELRLLLLPRDPNDSRNVVMEIRGGVGGEEAMLFAADLFRMYVMYAEARGWKLEVVSRSETELGGVKEISFTVEGDWAWGLGRRTVRGASPFPPTGCGWPGKPGCCPKRRSSWSTAATRRPAPPPPARSTAGKRRGRNTHSSLSRGGGRTAW